MKDLNKYMGCLIGGAAGDALGYAVEFLREDQIFEKYGDNAQTVIDSVKKDIVEGCIPEYFRK